MPRKRSQDLVDAFESWYEEGNLCRRVKCKYCGWNVAESHWRQAKHIRQDCSEYRKFLQTKNSEIEAIHQDEDRQLVVLTPERQAILHRKAAKAIYMGARPFSMLTETYFRDYQESLSAYRGYKPPTHTELAGPLLNEVYNDTVQRVDAVTKFEEYLNIVMDESTDVADHRIINLCVVTAMGAFYYETDDSGALSQNAENLKNWLFIRLAKIVGDDGWWRINSLTTDTCATMRAVWSLIQADRRTAHVFCIPCDSHGLQLLIKDLLSIEPFQTLLEQAQTVARFFRRAKLQHAILREHQYKIWGTYKAFVLSVITRWGTQAGLIGSVLANKDAVSSYLDDSRIELAPDVRKIVLNTTFWACLGDLYTLIKGISERQKMSESSHSHIGKVWPRWEEIQAHIQLKISELETFKLKYDASNEFMPAFTKRRATQLDEIHMVTYFLDPTTVYHGKHPSSRQNQDIFRFLERYSSTSRIHTELRHQYVLFRSKQDAFSHLNPVWEVRSHALQFWQEVMIFAPELSKLALRIFHTPSNSVPSERAFSTRNLVHDKRRNRLSSEKANKIAYIHVNERILTRNAAETRGWVAASESQLCTHEDECIDLMIDEEPAWAAELEASCQAKEQASEVLSLKARISALEEKQHVSNKASLRSTTTATGSSKEQRPLDNPGSNTRSSSGKRKRL